MVKRRFFQAAATLAFVAAAAAAGPARVRAQALPRDPAAGYIVITEPSEWTGKGVRGIIRWRQPVRVRGSAYHASGIRAVTLNGVPAALLQDRSGDYSFVATIPAEAASRGVEIIAYPNAGPAVVRHQYADGSAVTEHRVESPPPAVVASAPTTALRVELGPLPPGGREAVTRSLQGDAGVVAGVAVTGAHLRVRAERGEYLVEGRDGAVRHRVAAPTPSAGAAALAEVLAQESGALQLEALAPPARSFSLEFALTSRGEFHLGEGIEFRVRPARAGYLTVIDLGTDGALTVLYPVDGTGAFVAADQEVRLPTTADRERAAPSPPYQASEPIGSGVVRAFVTPRPLALGSGDAALTADAVTRALQAASAGGEPWSTALLRYRIVP